MLTHLLGIPGVRNYDGSWTEWATPCECPSWPAKSQEK
ncbi:putative thiosulfate sulfurtransferase sseA domain protein [Mycobacterium xenopi 4042]|uniref:Putative thiosulfate sulfurtransferase sseA domain protein n=1 Tax=Mycobacterium xenopi 4042 TaxID=1299334 RepID=X7YJU9_MYCXE|nr:putative thiosulfate sulfurtransferase sseA domain protein [Mycobacterium xenopi 4042]